MKNILVPTDFSEYAYNACLYAMHLASEYNGKLTVFHAYHIPIVDPLMPSEYLSDLADSAEKEVQNNIEKLIKDLHEYQREKGLDQFEIKHYITMGFAVDEIIGVSEQVKPDMIVMGRRYTEGMGKVLLGSVTSSVLEKAKLPVLIVPENVQIKDSVSNVLYAIEYEEADVRTINNLLEITKPLNAKVHCVHIAEENEKVSQKVEELKKTYSDEISMQYIDFQAISSGDILQGLSNYVESNKIDIMAMLTHKRSFFTKLFDKSLTKKMAFETNIPLIVFHEKME